MNVMRFDLQMIASLVQPGWKVLDLGCGEGKLLGHLKESKGVIGTGIERDEEGLRTIRKVIKRLVEFKK